MGLAKQILIDLDKFYETEELLPPCDELKSVIEKAIRTVVCRHCEDAGCVSSCPQDALKKEGEHLKRSNYLCTGCKTCILACPFGVNIDEIVEYKTKPLNVSMLDTILEKCPFVEKGKFEETDDIVKIEDNIFVKTTDWRKQLGLK
jgi:Fe-S-cluster-containing hydrogenase component 2